MQTSSLILLSCICALAFYSSTALGAAVEQTSAETVNPSNNMVQIAENLTINADCYQPKLTGRCFALFRRYAFNVETQKCEQFIYGGCNGNKNNFEDLEGCVKHCFSSNDDESQVETTTVAAEADSAANVTMSS